jgi:hypothetical protein
MDDMKPTEGGRVPARRRSQEVELRTAERDRAVELLSRAFSPDHLTTEEFERRVAEAYRVLTPGALARLIEDPPAPSAQTTSVAPAPSAAPVLAWAIFSSIDRSGGRQRRRHEDGRQGAGRRSAGGPQKDAWPTPLAVGWARK